MGLGKIIEDFDSLVKNMTPEQIKVMDEVNNEDDEKYKIPEDIELDLPDDLLENQGKKSKMEELFEGYEGDPEDREVVDWGEDVGKERFWERK